MLELSPNLRLYDIMAKMLFAMLHLSATNQKTLLRRGKRHGSWGSHLS